MSKQSQRRKRRHKKHNHFPKPMGQKEKHSKKQKKNETQKIPVVEVNQAHSLGVETKKNSTGKKDPVEVTETVRHFTETVKKSEPVNNEPVNTTIKEPTLPAFTPVIVPLTINNTLIKKHYKVVKKPSNWATATCKFVGQIGKCDATDHKLGARLEFESGEKVFIAFDGLELAADPKATRRRIPLPEHLRIDIERTPETAPVKLPVTDTTAKKGSFYKVVTKPARWKVSCKFLNKTGKCIAIDDRGLRLRFEDGTDVSFEPGCLEEVASMDLNNKIPKNGITEDNFQYGELFIVTSKPENLHDNGEQLVGKVGKGIWANYHGICVKFDGGAGYVIYFENLERYNPNRQIDNPVKVPTTLNANNIVFGRKYKFARKRPGKFSDETLIGQLVEIKWASYISGARIAFTTGEEMTVPFECLEEQKRPSDFELIELIKKNPHRILRIVKGLEKLTKLKPVQDFVRKGILPKPIPAPPRVPDANSEIFGPQVPRCMTDPYYGHCDESQEAESRVVALIGPIKSENEAVGNAS